MKNESSILTSLNKQKEFEPNILLSDEVNNINSSIKKNNIESNINKEEEYDELGYKETPESQNNYNLNLNKKLDSSELSYPNKLKFSIDMPNVSKQKLHDYLNEDLLNAIEQSPNMPILNNDIEKMKINESQNNDNNPNSLYGLSLYQNYNGDSNINFDNTNFYLNSNQINGHYFNDNNPNNNIVGLINNSNPNNLNTINDYNMNNNIIDNININNNDYYIPIEMRNKDINNYQDNLLSDKNDDQIFNNNVIKNSKKKKYDNQKINNKKDTKLKKRFELRIGDWTCNKCNNLNFSFRIICNRCGLPKEISEIQNICNPKEDSQIMFNYSQNMVYQQNYN